MIKIVHLHMWSNWMRHVLKNGRSSIYINVKKQLFFRWSKNITYKKKMKYFSAFISTIDFFFATYSSTEAN